MPVHTHIYGLTLVFLKGIGSHGYNREVGFFLIGKRTYSPCSLIAVHIRHLNIHKHKVIITSFGRHNLFIADSTILSPLYHETSRREDFLCNLGIKVIIFCKENSLPFKYSLISLNILNLNTFLLIRNTMRQGDNKGSSHALLT